MTRQPVAMALEILEDAIRRAIADVDQRFRPRFEQARANGWNVAFAMLLEARAQEVEARTEPYRAAYARLAEPIT